MSRERWLGGYIHRKSDGRPLFIIEREVGGKRYHLSTRASTERGALAQLALFEADPAAYQARAAGELEPLYLTAELIIRFHQWSVTPRPKGKGNGRRHSREMSRRLTDWSEDLAGLDLRRLTLKDHLAPALARRGTCHQHRIIAIKSLYSWLRRVEHLATAAQDPTLDLKVPQAEPEKWRRRKVVPWEVVAATFRHLAPAYRSVLQLLAATGWHVAELERFARNPESSIETPPREVVARDGRRVLAVLVTRHKSGGWTRTPVLEEAHLEAARELRARGTVPRRLNEAVKAATAAASAEAVKAGGKPFEPFTLGVMRHSVATWAAELGAAEADISQYLGHADPRTTRRFYLDLMVPTVAVPTRVLR